MTQQEKIKAIIMEKVNGVWEPCHDDNGHRYRNTQTGHIQRSVTTKLAILSKPHLISWAVKVGAEWLIKEPDRIKKLTSYEYHDDTVKGMQLAHTDIRDDAGNVGTVAHNAAERYINEWIATNVRPRVMAAFATENCDPRAIASMRAVEAFFHKHEIIPIASEILVGDIKLSAGTLDFLCIMNGKLTLIDFKTSNAVDQVSYSMQVAAYKYFFEKMTGLKIQQCKILHLSKDYDKFEVWKLMNIPKAWKAFKQVCGLYDWMYGSRDKIIRDIKRISI